MNIDTHDWPSCVPPSDVVQVIDTLLGFSVQMAFIGGVMGGIFAYVFVPFLISTFWKWRHEN